MKPAVSKRNHAGLRAVFKGESQALSALDHIPLVFGEAQQEVKSAGGGLRSLRFERSGR